MNIQIIILSAEQPIVRLIGFFIAMIIMFYIWNVRNKKKDKDKENQMK